MRNLVITNELKIQLELLAFIDPSYASDLIMALLAAINEEKLDPDEMPYLMRKCFIYWIDGEMGSLIKVED